MSPNPSRAQTYTSQGSGFLPLFSPIPLRASIIAGFSLITRQCHEIDFSLFKCCVLFHRGLFELRTSVKPVTVLGYIYSRQKLCSICSKKNIVPTTIHWYSFKVPICRRRVYKFFFRTQFLFTPKHTVAYCRQAQGIPKKPSIRNAHSFCKT